ncbi:hypothetical protein HDU76_005431, partial [Blyttiomyces sp. JEL0837]
MSNNNINNNRIVSDEFIDNSDDSDEYREAEEDQENEEDDDEEDDETEIDEPPQPTAAPTLQLQASLHQPNANMNPPPIAQRIPSLSTANSSSSSSSSSSTIRMNATATTTHQHSPIPENESIRNIAMALSSSTASRALPIAESTSGSTSTATVPAPVSLQAEASISSSRTTRSRNNVIDSDDDDDDDDEADNAEERDENVNVAPSASDGIFQSQVPLSKKRKIRDGESGNKRETGSDVVTTEECTECVICMDYVTTSGRHKVVCLKCGHVFGDRCIRDWIKRRGKSASCPTCKKPTKINDIRQLFIQKMAAVDTTQLTNMAKDRDKLRTELENVKKLCSDMNVELTRLKSERENWRQSLISMKHSFALGINNSVRVGAASEQLRNLYVACSHRVNEYGIQVIPVDDPKRQSYKPIHESLIRDCKVSNTGRRDMIMTVSMDKTLKMFNKDFCNTVTIPLPRAAWSCTFDTLRPEFIYAGLCNESEIQLYDIRNVHHGPLKSFKSGSMGGPGKSVHSLYHVEEFDLLVGGSLGRSFMVDCPGAGGLGVGGGEAFRVTALDGFGEQCTSLAYDEVSKSFLSSWRNPDHSRHICGKITMTNTNTSIPGLSQPHFNRRSEIKGTKQLSLSRSKVFTYLGVPAFIISDNLGCGSLYTLFGDDDNSGGGMQIAKLLQRFHVAERDSVVMDFVSVGFGSVGGNGGGSGGGVGTMAILSEKSVELW